MYVSQKLRLETLKHRRTKIPEQNLIKILSRDDSIDVNSKLLLNPEINVIYLNGKRTERENKTNVTLLFKKGRVMCCYSKDAYEIKPDAFPFNVRINVCNILKFKKIYN